MPRERSDAALLWDMLRASEDVVLFTRGKSFIDYERDAVLKAAVERKIEIVGEAARYVSPQFQVLHPEVPWRAIRAQRHVIAHEYGEIIDAKLWTVVTVHIPALMDMLRPLVPTPPAPLEQE